MTIRRREFLTLLGGAAAWPHTARAQQPPMPVIGFLGSETPASFAPYVAAFQQGLKETGYAEGKNVAIEYRWAEGKYDRLPALAADLAHRQVRAIIANVTSARATLSVTTTIPIILATAADPVEQGLVASLGRPGGNPTGATSSSSEIAPKLLELLREVVPTATVFAALINQTGPLTETYNRNLQAAAHTLGVEVHVLYASTEREIDAAFESLAPLQARGLAIQTNAFFVNRNAQLAALAIRHAVPTIFQYREFPAAGGLMSYGGDLADAYRVAGVYAGRILQGAKPADLPVQQSTKVELIINLKTAKALGLTVPLALLTRADEVIE
jgi:putative tryptophan/tyrosine transport system substrate-binding protein